MADDNNNGDGNQNNSGQGGGGGSADGDKNNTNNSDNSAGAGSGNAGNADDSKNGNSGAGTDTGGNNNSGGGAGSGALDAILSKLDESGRNAVRAELERARGDAAKYRTKASKFGDIDPERAKTAIAKLDELEEQAKTETQKATDRASAAEQERDRARKDLWRERVGRKHGLSDTFVAMLAGDSEEDMDEHGKKIADELAEVRKRPGDSVPATPKPNQSPGSQNSEEIDPEKIAAQALAR